MGAAAETWRGQVYAGFSGATAGIETPRLAAFIDHALALLDDSIARNRRDDGLYHAYNLLRIGEDGHGVDHLHEMLEGQVAVLASGVLTAEASADLLDRLRESRLYRPDQNGYILYPDLPLPGFLQKNLVPAEMVEGNSFLRAELEAGRQDFIERDRHGQLHFNGRFRNADELRAELEKNTGLSASEVDETCTLFETVFRHQRFTGRSGSMYKYEGLGCIYWHMVSKLLLAVGELLARDPGDPATAERLAAQYAQIKAGLGVDKSPAEYGAFTTDAYSHTPAFAGVQQPGMTGQVKEDVISRFAELGVRVRSGEIRFEPSYLARDEFSTQPAEWRYAAAGEQHEQLPAGSLAFLLCGVPVVYRLADTARIRVHADGAKAQWRPGNALGQELSAALFRRDGAVKRIDVEVESDRLR
jgi:hypothetical protein